MKQKEVKRIKIKVYIWLAYVILRAVIWYVEQICTIEYLLELMS